jgi:rfaE bifunctional protein nucleotidyltransferase chain/domain
MISSNQAVIMAHAASHIKIQDLTNLASQIAVCREQQKKVVLCHGVFDLLHVGHIRYLMSAKERGDVLVVSLTSDKHVNKGPHRPAFNQQLRAESIASLEAVDYVVVNDAPSAVDVIKALRPSYYVKGKDYKDRGSVRGGNLQKEETAIVEVGGQMAFVDEDLYSSSHLINSHLSPYNEATTKYLQQLRTKFPISAIEEAFTAMRKLRVLVVGETIIDEYQFCESIGKAGKEPVLVARSLSSEEFGGGAIAIANHVAGFCDQVGVLSCLGSIDSHARFVKSVLKKNVHAQFVTTEGRPTIKKKRYVEGYSMQKLFEVYTIDDDRPLPDQEEQQIIDNIKTLAKDYDVVLVADYGHGMISAPTVNALCEESRFLAVNTQANAGNRGFHTISRYPRADYVSISEVELRLEMRRRSGDPREMISSLLQRANYKKFTVTRGRYGLLTYDALHGFVEGPAFTGQVVDRVGSGDAVLSVTAPLAALNIDPELLVFVGNVVGAEAVKIVGHRSFLEYRPIMKSITSLLK